MSVRVIHSEGANMYRGATPMPRILASFLERHDCVSEGAIGITSTHRLESLQEGDKITTLGECQSPQGWR
jgi:hypothetical protein